MNLSITMLRALEYCSECGHSGTIYGSRPITKSTIGALARRGLVTTFSRQVCGVEMPHCKLTPEGVRQLRAWQGKS